MLEIKVEEVRLMSKATGISFEDCRRSLMAKAASDAMDSAQSLEDLKPILAFLLDQNGLSFFRYCEDRMAALGKDVFGRQIGA